jgi:hypothetical protein
MILISYYRVVEAEIGKLRRFNCILKYDFPAIQ